ncbi:MAG TPA: hypothetical protein IAC93_01490 [Candidatus Limisoma gallistercoris]|nr:hypothetical protein [Candidatus Limisoma gallistercoris]
MKKILLFLSITLSLAMTSCLDNGDEPNTVMTANYACYNNVEDLQNNPGKYELKAGTYVFTMDVSNMKLDLAIRGNFGESGDVNLTINGLDMKLADYEYNFSADVLTPEVADGIAGAHTIQNLKGSIHPYVITNDNQTAYQQVLVYQVSFVLDGRYRVTAISRNPYIFSQNTTTISAGGNAYSTKDTYYEVKFADTSKADVYIYNARFVEEMPQGISFTLKEIPVTLTANGYTLQIDEITPVLSTSETPATQYPISDFRLDMNGTNMSLQFKCNPDVPNFKDTYTVTASGSVYPPENNQY